MFLTLLSPLLALALLAGLAFPGTHASTRWQLILHAPAVHLATGVAIDLRGDPRASKWAYTADTQSGTIVKFGTNGRVLRSWPYRKYPSSTGFPSLAVGGSGNLFVADSTARSVAKYSPQGTLLARWPGFQAPRGIALDRAGNVYVAEFLGLRVTKLSSSGETLARWSIPWANGSGQATPSAVALDPWGRLYVAATCYRDACTAGHGDQQDEVLRLSSTGAVQADWFGQTAHGGVVKEFEPWSNIDSLTTDRGGNWYVSSSLQVRTAGNLHPGDETFPGVVAYSSNGYPFAQWPLPRPYGPGAFGLALDPQGRLYAATITGSGSGILRLAPPPPNPSPSRVHERTVW